MTKYVHKNRDYFNGQEISEYGKANGYVDYNALAKGFSHILNNTVINAVDDWDIINGGDYDEETDEFKEFFQYYIISTNGAQVLQDCTDETVYYSGTLDMYIWAVDHYGTSWDYVLTDIQIVDDRDR